jgi:hypothetical protein
MSRSMSKPVHGTRDATLITSSQHWHRAGPSGQAVFFSQFLLALHFSSTALRRFHSQHQRVGYDGACERSNSKGCCRAILFPPAADAQGLDGHDGKYHASTHNCSLHGEPGKKKKKKKKLPWDGYAPRPMSAPQATKKNGRDPRTKAQCSRITLSTSNPIIAEFFPAREGLEGDRWISSSTVECFFLLIQQLTGLLKAAMKPNVKWGQVCFKRRLQPSMTRRPCRRTGVY